MLDRLILAVAVSVGIACPGHAAVVSANVPCGPGADDNLTLWIEATSGTCNQTIAGVFECWESEDDYVKASCLDGCVETRIDIGSQSIAGCWQGPNPPGLQNPNHTVWCKENGQKFDLKGVPGDKCVTEKDSNGVVTGGKCSQIGEGNQEQISAQASCSTGCGESKPPGDCTQR